MNSYDFDKIMDRSNTSSVKWSLTKDIFGKSGLLPMWVADMDFPPPKEVITALQKRLDHEIFGYTFVPPSTAKAIQNWVEIRHGWKIKQSWLSYSTGVVPALSTIIQALSNPGDKVLLQSPVYTPFFDMIENNGRIVTNSALKLVENRYEIDFDDFESKLKEGVKLFVLCNPHNPGGRVWKEEELRIIGELCLNYDCVVVADEIHSDLVFKPHRHIPIASLNEKFQKNAVTLIAPSKTFNLAGLQASAMIIPDQDLFQKIDSVQKRQGFFTLNTFGIGAMEAAYKHGESWLDQLLSYLKENITVANRFIQNEIPSISMMEPEGTYLLWLNCRALGLSDHELKERLIQKGELALEPGTKYGPGGEGFVRMNIATSRVNLQDGLNRLKKAFS